MSIDKSSDTWEEIEKFVDSESVSVLKKLVLKNVDEKETQFLRGAYAVLLQLKQLPDKKPIPLVDIDNYN